MTTRETHTQGDHAQMASKTNAQTTGIPTTPAEWDALASSLLQDVPAATLQTVKADRPRGNSADNAAAMVKALLASSTEVKVVTFQDVSDWTIYRSKTTKAIESVNFAEARRMITTAASTTEGRAYVRLEKGGSEQVRIVNVDRNPLNAAKAIITDVALLKGRKQSDGTRSRIADAGRYFARALQNLDDAQRTTVAEFARNLGAPQQD